VAVEEVVAVLVVRAVAVVVADVAICTYIGLAGRLGAFTTTWSGPPSSYSTPLT
jgi:hypothetical protein